MVTLPSPAADQQTPDAGPRRRDAAWRYLPLYRDGDGGRYTASLPEYLTESGAEPADVAMAAAVWSGSTGTWGELEALAAARLPVPGRRGPRAPVDVGILPEASGLVILDCDVRTVEEGTGWIVRAGHAVRARTVQRRGIDDLARVCAALGHDPAALLDTFTVRTPSGGVHLYYRQCPEIALTNRGHREGWLIDVKASRHTWCVAPPTAGYSVERDRPARLLPPWLAAWLGVAGAGLDTLPPLGGWQARRLAAAAVAVRAGAPGIAGQGATVDGVPLYVRWVNLLLAQVELAGRVGGWNQTIYQVTLQLVEGGLEPAAAEQLVLAAADPWNAREARTVAATVRSALRRAGAAR